ncbi:MAG: NAD(P)H-dependent oxidoreductase, partial [Balneolales bacterium]
MTLARKKILAISGSTKQQSTNLNLIKAIAELSADQIELMLYDGLSNLPHFNPDMDDKNVSGHVKDFRQLLQSV